MSHFNSYAITCPSLIFFIVFGYIIFLGQTSMMSGVCNIRKKFAAIRNNIAIEIPLMGHKALVLTLGPRNRTAL